MIMYIILYYVNTVCLYKYIHVSIRYHNVSYYLLPFYIQSIPLASEPDSRAIANDLVTV